MPRNNIAEIIKRGEEVDTSDEDLINITRGKTTILPYEDLHKINHIDELFKDGNIAVTLLYQTQSSNVGHWVALIKKGPTELYFFDSYGLKIDQELELASYNLQLHNGVATPHLTALINKSNYRLTQNTHRYQRFFKDVNSCGRWTSIRILYHNLSDEQFKRLFSNLDKSGDWYVTALTILFTLEFN